MIKSVIKSFFLIWILFLIQTSAQSNHTISKWQVLDIQFTIEKNNTINSDLTFGAVFMHESGQTINIPGFYNGNNEFILRASFSVEGIWKFITYSQNDELNGKTGLINVISNSNKNKSGCIKVSNTHPGKFTYEDGKPYISLAFEIDWLFALDCENEHDIPNTKAIVGEIKKSGFNQVVMNVYAYDVKWKKNIMAPGTDFSKPKTFPFEGTNENPDYSNLNYNFFKHLDRVIKHLDENGIIAHLMIYVWNKKVSWSELNSTADNIYFDHIIKRYQSFPNIIWDISKEALGYDRVSTDFITKRIDRIRELDQFNRIITVHDYKYCKAYPQKVDFISIQNHSPNLYDIMKDVKSKFPNKPIVNIEHGGYETTIHENFKSTYSDAEICLSRNYICMFAGTYSTYYWQNTAWHEVITKPFDLPKEQQPSFHYYEYFKEFFEKYDFNNLDPIQMDQSTFCLTDDSLTYLFYIPEGLNRVNGESEKIVGRKVKWTIFNPLDGIYHAQGTIEYRNKWITYFRPENLSDSFLIGILELLEE